MAGVVEPKGLTAEVWRGDIKESLHTAYFAAVNAKGDLLGAAGDPDFVTTLRSAAKPLQAIPLTTLPNAASLDMRDEELAICCASHPGLPRHAALAASVLALSGFCPDDLVCGPAGDPPAPLRHGCSGNHACLLVQAHLLGAPLSGYHLPDHPVQLALNPLIAELAGTNDMKTATDGCGIPTYGLRLREMARAFARLTEPEAAWERIPRVMGAHPELVGGEDWIDVRLMEVTRGRLIAKTGAEGLLCVGRPGQGEGMALKILDGSTRALGAVTLVALARLGWITPEEAADARLADLSHPRLLSSTGDEAAEIRVAE